MNKRNFNIKLDAATIKVARLALLHADIETEGRGPLHSLKTGKGCVGTLSMEKGPAGTLRAALATYAEEEVREGSDSHKIATQLTAALGDFILTPRSVAVEAKLNEQLVGGALPTPNDTFERRMKEKRDAIFREIIGKPAEMTIWGTPRLPEDDSPKGKRIPANRMTNRVKTLDGVVGGIEPAYTPSYSRRVRLSAQADAETDADLTEGVPQTHNEHMMREGAQALMVNKNRPAGEGTAYAGSTFLSTGTAAPGGFTVGTGTAAPIGTVSGQGTVVSTVTTFLNR